MVQPAARVDPTLDRIVAEGAALRSACAVLEQLYPRSRYPELPMPSVEDVRQALDAAGTAWKLLGGT